MLTICHLRSQPAKVKTLGTSWRPAPPGASGNRWSRCWEANNAANSENSQIVWKVCHVAWSLVRPLWSIVKHCQSSLRRSIELYFLFSPNVPFPPTHANIFTSKNVIKYIICGQVTSSYTTFVCMKVSYEVCQAKCKHFVLHSYLATGHATCSCWRKAITVAFAERVRVEHLHSGCLTCQSVCSCSNLGNLLSLFSNSTLSDWHSISFVHVHSNLVPCFAVPVRFRKP